MIVDYNKAVIIVQAESRNQAKERQLTRLSHDAIVNLHALPVDLDDYVLKIDMLPDLDNLISLTYCSKPVLLSYDTTYIPIG